MVIHLSWISPISKFKRFIWYYSICYIGLHDILRFSTKRKWCHQCYIARIKKYVLLNHSKIFFHEQLISCCHCFYYEAKYFYEHRKIRNFHYVPCKIFFHLKWIGRDMKSNTYKLYNVNDCQNVLDYSKSSYRITWL